MNQPEPPTTQTLNRHYETLSEKIRSREAVIGIIGLGYVGLPLAMAFAEEMTVVGYDRSTTVVETLHAGKSHIIDIGDEELQRALESGFRATIDHHDLAHCDVIIICVPTPIKANKQPDIGYIEAAARTTAEVLRPGMLVVLESTTFPGTTEEYLCS